MPIRFMLSGLEPQNSLFETIQPGRNLFSLQRPFPFSVFLAKPILVLIEQPKEDVD